MSLQLRQLALAALVLIPIPCPAQATDAGLEFFEKRIRPLFTDNCYECHSTETKMKGGLLLDSREGWMKGGDSGPALIPGDPARSRLIKAVRYDDPDLQMPPKRRLSAEQVADLEQWIKLGAPDPRTSKSLAAKQTGLTVEEGRNFWAYRPVQRTTTPAVRDQAWPRTDIDRFLLAAMEAKQLRPTADADRLTLARRAYFDLTGLPPTAEQLDRFVADSSPKAFEQLIDELLASPRFGENWARHWLDVARFGESVTLRGLVFKEAWRYRDYVIEAFNRDTPYNQFVREQIAGDLLPFGSLEEQRRQLIATTFLMLGNSNFEEQDKNQLEMDVVDEQLDTLGKAFLAQTVGCARCHDHKFDPIPTRDYYALAGILKNATALKHANVSGWMEVPLPLDAEQQSVFKKHEQEVASLEKEIAAVKREVRNLAGKSGEPTIASVEKLMPEIAPVSAFTGAIVDSVQARAVGDWKFSQHSKRYIGDGYLHDQNKGKGEKTLTFLPDLKQPGRYDVRLAYIHSPSRAASVPVTIFHADGETTVQVNQQEAPTLEGRFVSLGLYRFEANGFGHVLVSTADTEGYVTADAVQFLPVEQLEPSQSGSAEPPTDPQLAAETDRLKTLEQKLKNVRASGPKRPMVMSVKDRTNCQDTAVHIRGSVHNLGPVVPRGYLTVATRGDPIRIPSSASGRRELAEWIADPDNPLTARVMVNRVWHWLMGQGLVRTVDNFGTTGEKPSHSGLLDFLAARFVEKGWSIKTLVREMMLSHVYQLGSSADAHAANVDPQNRLITHMNRRRLTAENLRDAMLSVSGELKLDSGGRTFPENLTSDYAFQFTQTRRSVYVPVFRNALPDIFEVFDFAPPSMVVGRRETSTVGPQALFLLNHPFVRERARAAALRLLGNESIEDRARLEQACRETLGRSPTPAERKVLLGALASADRDNTEAWTSIMHALFASVDFRYLN